MKIETIRRYDQNGFWIRPEKGMFLLSFHHWPIGIGNARGWLFRVNLWGGAGRLSPVGRRLPRWAHKWTPRLLTDGFSAFIGWRARGGIPGAPHGPFPRFRAGLTRNANAVPFGFAG